MASVKNLDVFGFEVPCKPPCQVIGLMFLLKKLKFPHLRREIAGREYEITEMENLFPK